MSAEPAAETRRRAAGVAREIVLRALRAAGDAGSTRTDLSNALDGGSPGSALQQLRRGGHRIEAKTESLGKPFNVQVVRYVLVVDATPALFED